MGAGNRVTLCDLGIFTDQAAEPVPAQNAHMAQFRRRMYPPGGRVLAQRPVLWGSITGSRLGGLAGWDHRCISPVPLCDSLCLANAAMPSLSV